MKTAMSRSVDVSYRERYYLYFVGSIRYVGVPMFVFRKELFLRRLGGKDFSCFYIWLPFISLEARRSYRPWWKYVEEQIYFAILKVAWTTYHKDMPKHYHLHLCESTHKLKILSQKAQRRNFLTPNCDRSGLTKRGSNMNTKLLYSVYS